MTNQEYLLSLSPEDLTAQMDWLWHEYGLNFTDTREAVLDWLKQDYKNPKKWGKCPYFLNCPHKTAMCSVLMPDKDCPLYKYLKQLIEENNEDDRITES